MTEPKYEPKEVSYLVVTDADCIGEVEGRKGFKTYSYSDGGLSRYPEDFFADIPNKISFGKCSAFGNGSCIRSALPNQTISIGRYVSAGKSVILMGGGFHETNCISTFEFGSIDDEINNVSQRDYGDIEIKNDVWIGDECMIMAGSTVENGCVIAARSLLPPRFKSEPYGIYAGVPARLKKFRFPENVRQILLDISWWDLPYSLIKKNNKLFLYDLTSGDPIEVLQKLKQGKEEYLSSINL